MMTATTPLFKHLQWQDNSSINFKTERGEKLLNFMHYHAEIELILFKHCEGTRIIGSSIDRFEHHDVVLIGKNVPHAFIHDEDTTDRKGKFAAEAIVVQFRESLLRSESLNLPELGEIQRLSDMAQQGLSLTATGREFVVPLIEQMPQASSLKRLFLLLEILSIIASKNCFRLLAARGEAEEWETGTDSRLDRIIRFTAENFDRNIKIEEVANIVNLTKESFCRYFKAQTHKTFMEFLIGYRVGKACQLLIENKASIKEIGYSCGFDTLSNFHHQFKKLTSHSPLEYKQLMLSRKAKQLYRPVPVSKKGHRVYS